MDMQTSLKLSNSVKFESWVGDKPVINPSNNVESGVLAFQSWKNFKEAFAPEIIYRAIKETPCEVKSVIDPFGGSGTTALASQFLGRNPTTIEVNPYLADLIEAKLTTYNVDVLSKWFEFVIGRVQTREAGDKSYFENVPTTFVEPGVKGKFIFSQSVAHHISRYRKAIELVTDEKSQRLLRVLLGSILLPVSNVTVSGKGRRYRKDWQTRDVSIQSFDKLFEDLFLSVLYDICRYKDRACLEYKLLRGDARSMIRETASCDLAVFSPPYPNSFDYTDVYNVELWALGYLKKSADNQNLRKATLRSHVQIHRDMSFNQDVSVTLNLTLSGLNEVRAELWNKNIPEMVMAYFADMGLVLSELKKKLSKSGRIYAVVGNSQYSNVLIPTSLILKEMAPNFGLKVHYTEEFRSMRTSPQQGGKEGLAESLIVFSHC